MTVRKLDFSSVSSRGQRIAEGDYLAELTGVEDKTFNSGNEGYIFSFAVTTEGPEKGAQLVHRQVLIQNQMWKYAELLAAFGHNVYGQSIEIDPEVLVGNVVGISVEDGEEYKGNKRSEIRQFAPASAISPGAAPTIASGEDFEDDDVDLEDLD